MNYDLIDLRGITSTLVCGLQLCADANSRSTSTLERREIHIDHW